MPQTQVVYRVLTFVILGGMIGRTFAAEGQTAYPYIPRIDVHVHVGGNLDLAADYLVMRRHLKETHGADLALWINLGSGGSPIVDPADVTKAAQGRMLCCISDYSSHDGLKYAPAELAPVLEKGGRPAGPPTQAGSRRLSVY